MRTILALKLYWTVKALKVYGMFNTRKFSLCKYTLIVSQKYAKERRLNFPLTVSSGSTYIEVCFGA